MKTLYLECAMGAAGDMLMSALSELIPDPEGFVREMNALGLPGVKIERQKAVRAGITGTHMAVTVDGQEEHSSDAEPGHDHHHEHEHDHEHHHHHDHDGHCCCGHDHDHDADEVFTSWGKETTHKYTEAELNAALTALGDVTLGTVLRAKGIVPCADGGEWLHFDYVPGAPEIRRGAADYTGRLCVIGSELDEERIAALFGVNEK